MAALTYGEKVTFLKSLDTRSARQWLRKVLENNKIEPIVVASQREIIDELANLLRDPHLKKTRELFTSSLNLYLNEILTMPNRNLKIGFVYRVLHLIGLAGLVETSSQLLVLIKRRTLVNFEYEGNNLHFWALRVFAGLRSGISCETDLDAVLNKEKNDSRFTLIVFRICWELTLNGYAKAFMLLPNIIRLINTTEDKLLRTNLFHATENYYEAVGKENFTRYLQENWNKISADDVLPGFNEILREIGFGEIDPPNIKENGKCVIKFSTPNDENERLIYTLFRIPNIEKGHETQEMPATPILEMLLDLDSNLSADKFKELVKRINSDKKEKKIMSIMQKVLQEASKSRTEQWGQ